MTKRIDLHTHSLVSDGTDRPADLVRAAAAHGLDVVALTDHDTSAGWGEAAAAARANGVTFVPGMEISTKHRGRGVHLLAYLVDPTHPDLVDRLGLVVAGRGTRMPAMLEALARLDVHLELDDVRRANPGTDVLGRPHVADALVAAGHVGSRTEAFDRYLGHGRPAYVDRYAVPVAEMVEIVTAAGGVSVVAHAWGRHGAEALTEVDLAMLAGLGLGGLEVDHQDHDPSARERLRAISVDLDLVVTGSSDYHGTGKVDHELGVNTTSEVQYDRLLARAADAAARSGRNVAEVVTP